MPPNRRRPSGFFDGQVPPVSRLYPLSVREMPFEHCLATSLSSPETKSRREEGCFRAGLGFAGGAFRSVKNEGDRQDRGGINPIKRGVDTFETEDERRYRENNSDDPVYQQMERIRKHFNQAGFVIGEDDEKQSSDPRGACARER